MHRIDGSGHVANQFSEGDPSTGTPATQVTDEWLNAVQEEIVNVIEEGGDSLDKGDNTQLLAKIQSLINDSRIERPIGDIQFSIAAPTTDYVAADGSGLADATYATYKAYFDADPYGFIAQWNATCAALGKAQITSAAGVTTVPDMSTLFVRAGTSGVLELDEFKSHTHNVDSWDASGFDNTGGNNFVGSDSNGSKRTNVTMGMYAAGGAETRPINIALPAWIKVK